MSDPDKPAVQREAEDVDETTVVEWRDLKLTLPASLDLWDTDTLEAFEKGQAVTAVRGLVGSKEYDKLRADFQKLHGRKIQARDLNQLGDVIAETYGLERQGE